jgi:hypothetical protein
MGSPIVEIRSHHTQTFSLKPFNVIIEAPERHNASGSYYCGVTFAEGQELHMDVYGANPQQAMRLALEMTSLKIAKILRDASVDELGEEHGESSQT